MSFFFSLPLIDSLSRYPPLGGYVVLGTPVSQYFANFFQTLDTVLRISVEHECRDISFILI